MAQSSPEVPLPLQLSRLVMSLWVPQALHAAAKLRIPELLSETPRPSADVAHEAGTDPGATHRLLRALAQLGVAREDDAGCFALTPLGACLREDSPVSVRNWTLVIAGERVWEAWGKLTDAVRTGKSIPMLLHGMNSFDYMARDPEMAATFDRAMLELTRRLAPVVAAAYDFSGVKRVMDVGGGSGALLAAILARHPHLRGVVFDRPACREGALACQVEAGVADRAEFVGGDFFESVPSAADVYFVKSVIHDWDDERSLAILRACRAALNADAHLVIVEPLLPERIATSPDNAMLVFSDLNMLVNTGGCERTEREYRALLESAGLRVERIVSTPTAFSLIDVVAA